MRGLPVKPQYAMSKMMRLAACLIFAVFMLCSLGFLQAKQLPYAIGLLFCVSVLLFLLRKKRGFGKLLPAAVILFAACSYFLVYANLAPKAALKLYEAQPKTITAEVVESPQRFGYATYVIVKTGGVKIQLDTYTEDEINLGDTIIFAGNLEKNPSEQSAKEDGVYLRNHNREPLTVIACTRLPLRLLPLRFCENVKKKIAEVFPRDVAAFTTALLTGDKSGLSNGFKSDLQRSGLAHVVVVSGMHLTALITLLYLFINRRIAPFVFTPIILFFLMMQGFSPSITKAGIMLLLMLWLPKLRRDYNRLDALATAAILILLFNPFSAASASFTLSFSATLGILLFAQKLQDKWTKPLEKVKIEPVKKVLNAGVSNIAASLSAMSLTLIPITLYFNSISIVTPIANLLTFSAILLFYSLSLLILPIGFILRPLAKYMAWLTAPLARYCEFVIRFFGSLKFSLFGVGDKFMLACVFMLTGLCACAYLNRRNFKNWWVTGLAALLICLLCGGLSVATTPKTYIEILNEKHGSATLLHHEKTTILIDCGTNNGRAEVPVINRLSKKNIYEIDLVILTSYEGHHINGLEALLSQYSVKEILLPNIEGQEDLRKFYEKEAQNNGAAVMLPEKSEQITIGGIDIFYLQTEGASSAAVFCAVDTVTLLSCSDMNLSKLLPLLTSNGIENIDCLLLPGHGAEKGKQLPLLRLLKPSLAVAQTNKLTYNPALKAALDKMNVPLLHFETDEIITIIPSSDKLLIRTEVQKEP